MTSEPGGRTHPPLLVRGVVLPEGERREFLVVDGRVTTEVPARGRTESVALPDGYVVPGLVDAHCHVGLDAGGAVSEEVQEDQARRDRDAGALLLRDAGSASDTRWIDDRPDLPRIIRAGRHIARTRRYIRDFGEEIEPDQLVATVAEMARRGDGWVKLVGDWIDRSRGELAPCWPADVVARAIAEAHRLGARVTAHVFGTEALPDLLAAGIDCIEHGTGLTPDLIATMAARQVGLVPTRLQVDNFPRFARHGAARFPAYAAQMERLYAGADQTFRQAYEAGVPLYAGTDAGGELPHGLIAREILALRTRIGMSAEDALAAGSWRARAWLGREPGLCEGAPADFVVYPTDPRDDLRVLATPARIVLRGTVVG